MFAWLVAILQVAWGAGAWVSHGLWPLFGGPACAPGQLCLGQSVPPVGRLALSVPPPPRQWGQSWAPLALTFILASATGSARQSPPTSGSEFAWPLVGASILLPAATQLNIFKLVLSFTLVPNGLAWEVQGLCLVDGGSSCQMGSA